MRLLTGFLAALLLFAMPALSEDTVDFSDRITETCEIAGLIAYPPEGWFNVPLEDPPAGHLGCMMMLPNESRELVGAIRVRSLAAPALDSEGEPYAGLFGSEVAAFAEMNCSLADEPLWVRKDVPVSGGGFRDGRALGFAATVPGSELRQEAHFLFFRSDSVEYLVTLLTPTKSADASLYERNTEDFGKVIRTLQPRR
jgi:hypothetical protein